MRPKRGQKQIGAVSRAEEPEGKMRVGSGAFLGDFVKGGSCISSVLPRLQILRLLLAAHPEGMVVGEVQEEMGIPASTLSHHLEKLKQVGLVKVRREGTYLWYAADTEALREVLNFLYEECCTRSRAVAPEAVTQISR